ncbi:glycoside hydrolase family 127 protein [Microbacterium timonense]|uniref:glycoside hydrolase family 127 protein n=1 Tax=Microbacterium timonense TaxID=2086576 RepID=UPI000D111C4C|nr:beta-L-arabinofuranosidase domain-containing protein [Microbacterium timonense]
MTLSVSPDATSAPVRTRAVPVAPGRGNRSGIAVDEVAFDPAGFWGRRQAVNAAATFAHCLDWMERLGWVGNFDRVARGETTTERPGWQFSDSEIYKLLEGMAWELGRHDDSQLATTFDDLVARVGSAQDDDGYLSTAFGHPGLPPRYSDLAMGHELYNMGHLIQAAVARARTGRPDDPLVGIARRAADHICREFGVGGRDAVCGHAEIEVALAEAGRAFGERRYLEQARLFVQRRGHRSLPVPPLLSAEYFQDDVPVRDAAVLRGHAVRALYLSAGAVDVAVETGDSGLFSSLERQWERTVGRRTYLTGGMGSRHQDEGFGEDFELPADRAYCETCAGVASVMFAWRLYLATGEVRYADVIERTLFNIIATSPSDDGRSFFYANPLHQRDAAAEAQDGVNPRAEGGVRAPWFEVSCCPTNVARTLASLGAYTASVDEDGVTVMQYAAGTIRAGGFVLRVETAYPEHGRIRIVLDAAPEEASRLRLRVPVWATGARLRLPGTDAMPVKPGWVDVHRSFEPGDEILLDLPSTPRYTWPDPRIDAVRGAVAVERGPLVLCLESHDLPAGAHLDAVRLVTGIPPRAEGDGALVEAVTISDPPEALMPYSRTAPTPKPAGSTVLRLVPYHRWAERGPSTMRVFVPVQSTQPEAAH